MRNVQRQAFAGMLWSKQYYRFFVNRWLEGDPAQPPPPRDAGADATTTGGTSPPATCCRCRTSGSTRGSPRGTWRSTRSPFAMIDPDFAKDQLLLLTREWYMHPNGQIPAYEWAFGDVNPPVHAWAASRVFQIEEKFYGRRDRAFLERVFQKLLLNFTWWVNRKDAAGNNIFEGGFLGPRQHQRVRPHIGPADGGRLEQADGTSWMAMYCLNLLGITLELAKDDPVYEDIATKFFEHFVYIGAAVNRTCGGGGGLWDEEDGFYFDVLRLPDNRLIPIRAKTIAGLTPVYACAVADRAALGAFADFGNRFRWFATYRPELLEGLADMTRPRHRRPDPAVGGRHRKARADPGARARSGRHAEPARRALGVEAARRRSVRADARRHAASSSTTRPAESTNGLFGGNSNWRGPVWFPLNFLLIEALQKHDFYLGEDFKVECPAGSGATMSLWDVTTELTGRLISLFTRDEHGRRPVHGNRAEVPDRSALARSHPVLRVLRRRHRRGPRREPPDRLDRHRRQADPPVRGVRAARRPPPRGAQVRLRRMGPAPLTAPLPRRWQPGCRHRTPSGSRPMARAASRAAPSAACAPGAITRCCSTATHAAVRTRGAGERIRGVARLGQRHHAVVDAALRTRCRLPAGHRSPGGVREHAVAIAGGSCCRMARRSSTTAWSPAATVRSCCAGAASRAWATPACACGCCCRDAISMR